LGRSRRRAPNLRVGDRLLFGLLALLLRKARIRKVAVCVRPSTLLAFHQALVRRKYSRLFSSIGTAKTPGPKGPSEALTRAIVELKTRNPRFGCPRIARIISRTFGVDIDKNVVSRVLAKHYRPAPGGSGPSWLSFIGHATNSLWSVDLFRCESIVLHSYWVLVVMDHSPDAWSASACTMGRSMCRTSAACSTRPFMGRVHHDVSAQTTIPCSRPTDGRRISACWRSTRSRPCRTCRCRTRSWNA